ncbi:MAG: Glucose-fructose oxidoreductase, partial [uncultured Craurococcus sp.]
GGEAHRHHHERRDRPDGDEPAPHPLHRRHPGRWRGAAGEWRPGDAGPGAGRAQPGEAGGAGAGAWRGAGLDRSRRLPGRSRGRAVLRCGDDAAAGRPDRAGDRGGQEHLCREADGRPAGGCAQGGAAGQGGRHQARRGAGQAVPARAAQAEDGDRQRLPRAHLLGEGRVRLLGLRGRPAAGTAAELELQGRRGRRHHPRYALPLALRARQPLRRGGGGELPRRHPYPGADRRGRPDLQGRCGRCGLCDLPTAGRHRRAYQLKLGDAGQARRPRHLPGRRHAWQRHRRPAAMLDAEPRQHAEAGLEPRHPAGDRLLRRLAGGAEHAGLSERLPRAVGDVPALPGWRGAELPLGSLRRRQGRAACRGGVEELAGAPLDRPPGAGGL